jgi:hypothetical protein
LRRRPLTSRGNGRDLRCPLPAHHLIRTGATGRNRLLDRLSTTLRRIREGVGLDTCSEQPRIGVAEMLRDLIEGSTFVDEQRRTRVAKVVWTKVLHARSLQCRLRTPWPPSESQTSGRKGGGSRGHAGAQRARLTVPSCKGPANRDFQGSVEGSDQGSDAALWALAPVAARSWKATP